MKTINVLIVEDNPADARLIIEMFKESRAKSFEHKTASTLKEALKELEEGGYDIILLDLNLPDSSGVQTYAGLEKSGCSLPVIVLTGIDDEELAIKLVQMGAQEYLPKNALTSELLIRSIFYSIERFALLKNQSHFIDNSNQLESLERFLSEKPLSITSRMYGESSIKEALPGEFENLTEQYVKILESVIESKIYKDTTIDKEELSSLAEKLGDIRATARDLIELHMEAMKSCKKKKSQEQFEHVINEGKIVLLEIMGNLAMFYRNYFINKFSYMDIQKEQKNGNQKKRNAR